MYKLHGKSVLLGIGIGIILTAILGIIFFLGYTPEMDEAKVKELAKKYGMSETCDKAIQLRVTISEEDTITGITRKLSELGIVKNTVSFQIKFVNREIKDKIIPGTYEFKGSESEDDIIDIITRGANGS